MVEVAELERLMAQTQVYEGETLLQTVTRKRQSFDQSQVVQPAVPSLWQLLWPSASAGVERRVTTAHNGLYTGDDENSTALSASEYNVRKLQSVMEREHSQLAVAGGTRRLVMRGGIKIHPVS